MKKLFIALALLACSLTACAQYIYNNEPTFTIGRHKYALTIQESDYGDAGAVTLLTNNGGTWQGWGAIAGQPFTDATVVLLITDADILAHGSLKNYVRWLLPEAMDRAYRHATQGIPADPADRAARLRYAVRNVIDVVDNVLVIPPPYDTVPLP